jgi:RHS repeat-associated protein
LQQSRPVPAGAGKLGPKTTFWLFENGKRCRYKIASSVFGGSMRTLVALAFLAFFATGVQAQIDPVLEQQKLFGAYSKDFDSISMVNGGLSIHIPLFSYPQRGGKLRLNLELIYQGFGWTLAPMPHNEPGYLVSGGPGGRFSISEDQLLTVGSNCMTTENGVTTGWPVLAESDGTPHFLGQTSQAGSIYGFRSIDATGLVLQNFNYQYTVYPTIIDRDGIKYTWNSSGATTYKTDLSGNVISYNITSGWTDTLGRAIPVAPSGTLLGAIAAPDFTGCQGVLPTAAAYLWTLPSPNGGTEQIKVCYADVVIQTNFTGNPSQEHGGGSGNEMQTVVVYNGVSWTTSPAWIFAYNDRSSGDPSNVNYGSLTQITFPTGGTASYAYETIASPWTELTYRRAVIQKTVNANDNTGPHSWNYSYNLVLPAATTIVTDPAGNDTVYTLTGLNADPDFYPTEIDNYTGSHSSGKLAKTVKTTYQFSPGTTTAISTIAATCTAYVYSVVPASTTTIWPNGQQSMVQMTYDAGFTNSVWGASPQTSIYGNPMAKMEYDYGSGAPGTLLRTTNSSYLALNSSSYLATNLLNLPSSVQVTDAGGVQRAYITYGYDEAPSPSGVHGNQTSVHKWLNTTGGYLTSTSVYNANGTVASTTDPKLYTTSYGYSSGYAGSGPTSVTNPLNQTTSHTYDFDTGLRTSTTDPNSQISHFTYNNLWQLASITHPDGGLDTITYQENTPPFTATITKAITSTPSVVNHVKTTIFDGLGRASQTQLTSDPSGTDYTITTYDGEGRKATVTNPYRTTSDHTYGITSYQYDALDRTLLVTKADGSRVTTTYTGNATTVTDEAGKTRESFADGIGRMKEVIEGVGSPNYMTSYTYDALDDLVGVVQGSRTRSFVYDSVKRMISSTNPEAGTVSYTYDGNGDVLTKSDARPMTITYTWDQLNRMTGRTYSDSETSVAYVYDGSDCVGLTSCYNVGHLTSMTDAAGSESYAYDTMGRPWALSRGIRTHAVVTKNEKYTYNLDGTLATILYPSGSVITYSYNAAGEPTAAADNAKGISYVSSALYAPNGAPAFRSLGGAVAQTILYNTRFQPCWNWAGTGTSLPLSDACTATATTGTMFDVKYNFNLGADNGNLVAITNDRNSNRSQAYGYDALNRITSAATTLSCTANCWGLTFGLDQWANLLSAAATGTATPLSLLTVNTNNQITTAPFTYDAAGHELTDATSTYYWNAEGQISEGGGVRYVYDGQGNRVEKSGEKAYWYSPSDEVLDETDTTGSASDAAFSEYVYFAGARIARRDYQNNVYYYFEDQVNSSRVIAEVPAGTTTPTLCYDADFYPYGGETDFTNTCAQNYKFQGKERDTETSNDYFGARFYSSTYGRFLSPDWSSVLAPVPHANLTNPQTLNLYAFVNDNPESFADLDGHCGEANGAIQNAACAPTQTSEEQKNNPQNQDQTIPNSPGPPIRVVTNFHIGIWARIKSWFSGSGNDTPVRGPNPYVTAGTDFLGVVAAVGEHEKAGGAIAIISLLNDHSTQNITLTGAGLLPNLNFPTAFIGAEADLLSFSLGHAEEQMIEAIPADTANVNGQTVRVPDEHDMIFQ